MKPEVYMTGSPRAVGFKGGDIRSPRRSHRGGRKPKVIGAMAAAVIAAAACAVWMMGGKSETALSDYKTPVYGGPGSKTEASYPTPIALCYPEPVTTPEPEKPGEPEAEAIYAIAPKKENAAPGPDAAYAAAAKEETTTEEIFAEEFPCEDFEKTKRTLARIIHGEAKGTKSVTNRAAIAETVLNRVDAGLGDTPYRCATARHQFCIGRTCTEEELWIAEDVLSRWLKIRRGEDAGWILPKDYLWFHGTYPRHDWNVFRNKYYHKNGPEYMTPLHSEIYKD